MPRRPRPLTSPVSLDWLRGNPITVDVLPGDGFRWSDLYSPINVISDTKPVGAAAHAAFEIDGNAITENGSLMCTGNIFGLTSIDTVYVQVYSDSQANLYFAVSCGQYFQ